MKTTPGPWVANGSERTQVTWVSGPDNQRICTVTVGDCDWGNAQFIAAAHAMYVALQKLVAFNHGDRYQEDSPVGKAYKAAREALKKADGL